MRILLVDINPFMPPVTPVSLGHVGAMVRARGHEVEILSLGASSRFSPRDWETRLQECEPRLVGFGAYQRNIHHVRGLARAVRQVLPEAAVVLGGPQATFLPEAALAVMPEIDYVSRGEGEQVLPAIVEALEGGNGTPPAPGATRRARDGACRTLPAAAPVTDLDRYPSPWLTGVLDPAATEESILLTSRGCTNACRFCTTPVASGGRIRSQSVDRALEDITHVARNGTGRLWFADPNFSFSEERVVGILEGILARGLRVSMWIETRADMVRPGLLALMQRAGVATLALGLESASAEVAPNLDKGIAPDEVGRAARLALEAGLDVELFSQYALPGERREDALATLKYVQDCGVAIRGNSNAQQMQLYFGAPLTRTYRDHGIRPLPRNAPPYLSIGASFETDWMSREEIRQVRDAWLAASLDGGKRVVS